MTDYQKYINALRKCAREHENDRTPTGHIIVSNLCKDTDNLLEKLEQEPILDKIRAEIETEKLEDSPNFCIKAHNNAVDRVLGIIDKYKAEKEEQECR